MFFVSCTSEKGLLVVKNSHHFISGDASIDKKRSISSVRDKTTLGIQTSRAKKDKKLSFTKTEEGIIKAIF